ncbi:MAG: hypothetical protein ACRDIX_10340 [Actinomycetota bacterium]
MKRITQRSGPAALVVLVVLAVSTLAQPALAHERREVGNYVFVVGFGEEPAFSNEKNSVGLTLTERQGREEKPVVEGADLEVEVVFGEERMTLPIEPRFVVGAFGEPGDYGAFFFPSRPGTYSFHFTGTIGGQEIDETFTSGPETFNDVEDLAAVSFPAQDPTTAQLADRLDRESSRVSQAVGQASNDADLAQILAYVGIGLGAFGLATAAASLARRKRAAVP